MFRMQLALKKKEAATLSSEIFVNVDNVSDADQRIEFIDEFCFRVNETDHLST